MRSIAWLRTIDVPTRMLDPLRRVGESLASLATDAVELPRMEAGSVGLQPALIGVRPLLRDVVDTIQPAAQDRGITVYLVVSDTTPEELIADPDRVRQIVTVLLAEALRFAMPDTMWLLADGGEDDQNRAVGMRVTIRGFGTPIHEQIRARMFPAFDAVAVPGRSDDATAPASAHHQDVAQGLTLEQSNLDDSAIPVLGTGLGPAIAGHLTALMGGQLRCETWSAIDGRTGNDFILTLPPDLLPGQRDRAPGHAPAMGRTLPRTRVLLAGAETGLRLAARTMLRRDGHMVDTVGTGAAAVQSLHSVPYDIAFIDSVLSDMSAGVAIESIRHLTGPARIVPLIVLAQSQDETDERPWRDAGADDVLPGHPTLEGLTGAIRRHVWHSWSLDQEPGFIPRPEEEFEEGIPILSAERILELRANLPREELLDMVEECIADLFHRLPALRRSLATGATAAITAQAHAMVGMAGGYGMAVLEARLRAILTAVRTHRLDTIDGAAAMVEADLTRAAAALRRTLQRPLPAHSGVPT
jgi:CheY-like chemotaxis protein